MDESKKELLVSAGVDLSGALERFMDNEKMYDKYLQHFTTTPNFADLQKALNAEEWRDALAISHNLKGFTGSLGFTHLYELLCSQVSLLRHDDNASAAALMNEIEAEYRRLLDIAKAVL